MAKANTKKHTLISPSGAHRWMNCLGAPKLEAKYPDKGSKYATEGTNAHDVLERCLKQNKDASWFVGKDLTNENMQTFICTKEMAEHVQTALDWIREKARELGVGEIEAETRVELPFIHQELAGTCDAILRQPFGELVVIDFKYGQGVDVEVVENKQLMIYGLGALGESGEVESFENIRLVILQPRKKAEAKEWVITPKELRLWGERVLQPAAKRAAKGSKSLTPGDWCRFCKAKANMACPKLNQQAVDVFKNETKTPNIKDFTPEQTAEILKQLPVFDIWRKALEEKAMADLMSGKEIPGFKLVEGRSNRKWINESEAQVTLTRVIPFDIADFYTQKFATPAQAEKKVKALGGLAASILPELIEKPAGKPTVVPVEDKRPALQIQDATTLFTNEEENDNE